MLPEGRKQGTRMIDRVASIADIAEPLLEVDRARGERAYIRLQGNGKLFISKSIFDTINFPKDHAAGRPAALSLGSPAGRLGVRLPGLGIVGRGVL